MKKTNRLRPTDDLTRVCGNCCHATPWKGPEGDHWNTTPDGEAITLHCNNTNPAKRGIFPNERACPNFKRL